MGCNKNLVLVCAADLAALEALVATQAATIAALTCTNSQLTGKLGSTQAKIIMKKAKTTCTAPTNCDC